MSKNTAPPESQEATKDALSDILNPTQNQGGNTSANANPSDAAQQKREAEFAAAQAELQAQNAELRAQLAAQLASKQAAVPVPAAPKEPETLLVHPHLGYAVPIKESLVKLALQQGFKPIEEPKAPTPVTPVAGF